MIAFQGQQALALPHHRHPAPGGPSQATTFREGGAFDSPGVAGSGSVAVCERCGGDLPLREPFRRVVLLAPHRFRYEHPGECPPAVPLLRLAPV